MRDIFCTLCLVMFGAFLVLSMHSQQFTMSIGSHAFSVGVQRSTNKLEARVAELEAAQAAAVPECDETEEVVYEEDVEDVVDEEEDVCDTETTCCTSNEVQMSCAFNDDEDAEEG